MKYMGIKMSHASVSQSRKIFAVVLTMLLLVLIPVILSILYSRRFGVDYVFGVSVSLVVCLCTG